MATPKYFDILSKAIQEVSHEMRETFQIFRDDIKRLEIQGVESLSTLKLFTDHMEVYNKELKKHIQHSDAAHKRLDIVDREVLGIQDRVKDIDKKVDCVVSYIEKETEKEKAIEEYKTYQDRKKQKTWTRLKNMMYIGATILGVPSAMYGFYKMFIEVTSGGMTP